MQLVECHIENYGKLSNFDYQFNAGWNSIKQANGWGKSTFASFVQAMFYGLPVSTKKNLSENERKKYTPWQGGNFGGNLVFTVHGKSYKIERFFGKTKAEDSFTLFDVTTGKKSKDFSENIGVELFGLDADAFERSSYIPQKVLESKLNESMTQKLTNLLQGATAEFNYDQVVTSLDQKRATLSNNKKTGQIQILENQIDESIGQIRELTSRGEALPVLQKQVATSDAQIAGWEQAQSAVQQQINAYAQLQQKQASQELYTELSRKVANTQAEINTRQAVLNHHQTSLTEVEHYLAVAKTVAGKENEMQTAGGADYVQAREQALVQYFHGQIPTPEKVQSVYNDVVKYNALKAQTAPMSVRQVNAVGRKRQWLCLGLVLFGLLCALCGVFACRVQMAAGVTLWVVGGAMLLVAGYLYLINMINVKTSMPQNVDYAQLQKHQAELVFLQKEIVDFLLPYESTQDYLVAIQRISNNLRDYENIQAQKAWRERAVGELSQAVAGEKSQLEKYLAQFKFPVAQQDCTEKLLTLKQVLFDLASLQTRLQTEMSELEQFKLTKHFDANESAVAVDINELQRKERELQAQIDAARDEKAQTIARINQIQNELAELNDLENKKENLQSEKKALEQTLHAVKSALKFLEAANQNMTAQFLAPMKQGVTKYLNMITGQKFDQLNLDTDFNIAFEAYGKLRTVDYYSQGYQNAIDLCLRFALVDALYQQEKPFIVLDDPLANLDEDKVAKAKAFLQALAPTYQIIYFSCHSSRC